MGGKGRTPRTGRRSFLALCAGLAAEGLLGDSAHAGSCGPPPKAKPQRWKAGEGMPPLPLPGPATPLRRSEKKREPAPPALIGKVEYGKRVEGQDERGHRFTYRDWTTDPADVQSLMRHVKNALTMDYRGVQTSFETFSWDPAELPVLYLTGHEGFEFDDELRKRLLWYLNDGGTLLGDACCGMDAYRESFIREMSRIFPRRKMEHLPADHPIFSSFHQIEELGFIGEDQKPFRGPPLLEGVHIGCRCAVVFTPFDLSCGWDGHRHDHGRRVWSDKRGPDEAVNLGVNILAYALASYQQGRQLAISKRYHEADAAADEKFVFGQVMHGGDWDPDPDAAANLLKYVAANTSLGVKFKKEPVDLTRLETFQHPILYLTGHSDFTLKNEEVETLRTFLRNGGVLFADACCGRKTFDAAFRREIARVVPNAKLAVVPLESPLYRATGTPLVKADFSPRVRQQYPDWAEPRLEGIALNGQLAVIYSAVDVGCAWEDAEHPYSLGYEKRTGLRLGASVLLYAMTH
jgi:hypothetical protein